ncbi:hypothetical protein EDB84DRAFT_1442695 [Lactarius hengduanensis]|nr:hypothetical protein EDB84DRAFT_1442695 [Lactarius hengduanensis]
MTSGFLPNARLLTHYAGDTLCRELRDDGAGGTQAKSKGNGVVFMPNMTALPWYKPVCLHLLWDEHRSWPSLLLDIGKSSVVDMPERAKRSRTYEGAVTLAQQTQSGHFYPLNRAIFIAQDISADIRLVWTRGASSLPDLNVRSEKERRCSEDAMTESQPRLSLPHARSPIHCVGTGVFQKRKDEGDETQQTRCCENAQANATSEGRRQLDQVGLGVIPALYSLDVIYLPPSPETRVWMPVAGLFQSDEGAALSSWQTKRHILIHHLTKFSTGSRNQNTFISPAHYAQ